MGNRNEKGDIMLASKVFQDKFKELWYRDQNDTEKSKLWLPGKRPHQVYEEFQWYLYLVSCIKSPIVVEIGAGGGNQGKFYRELLGTRQYITVDIRPESNPKVLGDSSAPETIEKVKSLLAGPIDILFIDGDHSRAGVLKDWNAWNGLVRQDGFIAFHDSHHDHASHCDGAVVLFNELKEKYESWDIFKEVNDDYPAVPMTKNRSKYKQAGIGLLRKGSQPRAGKVYTSEEFREVFYEQWYHDQTPAERAKLWYPEKRPRQIASELELYFYIVSSIRNPICVEIGVARNLERPYYEKLLGARQYLTVDIDPSTGPDIVGDSTDQTTVGKAKEKLVGPVDILFIDGTHDRRFAPIDWDLWTPLVRSGGYIGLDDSHHDHASYCDGSAIVWNEQKERYAEKWDLFDEVTRDNPVLPMTRNRAKYKQAGIGVFRVP